MVGFLDFTLAPDPSGQIMAQRFAQTRDADLVGQLLQGATTDQGFNTEAFIASLLSTPVSPQLQQLGLAGAQQIQAKQEAQRKLGPIEQRILDRTIDRNFKQIDSLEEAISNSQQVLSSLDELNKLNDQGITGPSATAALGNLFGIDLGNASDRAAFDAIAAEGIRRYSNSIGSGGIRNQAEFNKFFKLLPSSSRSPSVNRSIIKTFEDMERLRLQELQLKSELLSRDPTIANIDAVIRRQLEPQRQAIVDQISLVNQAVEPLEQQAQLEIRQQTPVKQVANVIDNRPANGTVRVFKPGASPDFYDVPVEKAQRLITEFGYQQLTSDPATDLRLY